MTLDSLLSPLAKTPSNSLMAGSCHLKVTLFFFSSRLRRSCLLLVSLRPICSSHWKGVWGLGTKVATDAVTFFPPAFLAIFRTLPESSAMAIKSSSVSVGRPIMKYSFMDSHPASNTCWADFSRSSSVIPLLITSLSLSLPASGAMVNPVFLTRFISDISSGVIVSTLMEGSDMAIFSSEYLSIRLASRSLIHE